MAVIKDVDFGACFTDVRSAMLNAFAQLGDVWHFAYVNTSGHAVRYVSTNLGQSWQLDQDYGAWDHIAVATTYDGSELAVTVSGTSYNQTLVYKSGALVIEADGTVPASGAVCFWPYLALLGVSQSIGKLVDNSTTPVFANTPPNYAVLGYAPDGNGLDVVGANFFDLGPGWSGQSANRLTNFRYAPANPSDPRSQMVLQADETIFGGNNGWVGISSVTLSGYVNFTDFSGFGAGGTTQRAVPDPRDISYGRGTFFTGYLPPSHLYVADRGLNGPHRTATGCTVSGYQCGFFVDRNGLFGSTVATGQLNAPDASGQYTPFVRAKVYGDYPNVTWNQFSYSAANQDGSLTVFLLGKKTGDSALTLFRLHDAKALDRAHAANTEMYSQTTRITQSLPTIRDPFQINPESNAMGTVQTQSTGPSFGIPFLIQACTTPSIVPNPNNSLGCSPILRELLVESGVAFSVTREVARDGDPNGHQGGNALDLAGPNSPRVLTGASATDAAYQEMAAITDFLRQVPSLFASVIHYDPITPQASLFIWDGRIVTADQFGGTAAQVVQDAMSSIHISSSFTRLLRGFQNPKITAALGLITPYTDPVTGQTVGSASTDPFISDRYVYVNGDGYMGSDTTGLAAEKLPAQIVNFW